MVNFFSSLYCEPTAFYFHSSCDKAYPDADCLAYLRSYDSTNHFFEAWPYDMPSYFKFVQAHKSIQTNSNLPLLEEDEEDSAISIWSLPLPVYKWMKSNSIEEITEQWVRFFSTWTLDNKENLALDQSPAFLHERIKDGFVKCRDEVLVHWNTEDDGLSASIAMADFIGDNPEWLQYGNSGNVHAICNHWTFRSFQFYARKDDVDWCKKHERNLVRVESDADAFYFWKSYRNSGRWITNEMQHTERYGFVYVFTDGQNFKIGYSGSHPEKRLAQCQTGNSRPLSLVGFIRGDQKTERQMHLKFSSKRVHGEWFQLSEADVKEILKH